MRGVVISVTQSWPDFIRGVDSCSVRKLGVELNDVFRFRWLSLRLDAGPILRSFSPDRRAGNTFGIILSHGFIFYFDTRKHHGQAYPKTSELHLQLCHTYPIVRKVRLWEFLAVLKQFEPKEHTMNP